MNWIDEVFDRVDRFYDKAFEMISPREIRARTIWNIWKYKVKHPGTGDDWNEWLREQGRLQKERWKRENPELYRQKFGNTCNSSGNINNNTSSNQ